MLIPFSNLTMGETIIDEKCSRFILGPISTGLGVTIGSAMRRALLSSIPGAAVVATRITGILHEFSTLPYILEDVTEIILNVKGITLLMHCDLEEENYKTLYLEAEGTGEVKALDITMDSNVTILNPDHHIATLSEDAYIRMELYVKQGRRYLNWSDEPYDENEFGVGVIRIDADFNPITKVHIYIDKYSKYHENLELTVWTNGGISPVIAVSKAASILTSHYHLFNTPGAISPIVESEDVQDIGPPQALDMDIPIKDLYLSNRIHRALMTEDINTLADLVSISEEELSTFRNLGRKSIEQIKNVIADYKLKLGMNMGDRR